MGRLFHGIRTVVEPLAAIAPAGVRRVSNDGIRPEYLSVGFATGVIYRHARAKAVDGGIRASPFRHAVLALALTPIHVAIRRSSEGHAGSRSFTIGAALGSAVHRLACRE